MLSVVTRFLKKILGFSSAGAACCATSSTTAGSVCCAPKVMHGGQATGRESLEVEGRAGITDGAAAKPRARVS